VRHNHSLKRSIEAKGQKRYFFCLPVLTFVLQEEAFALKKTTFQQDKQFKYSEI
jgi:hypothetical protein